MADAAKLPPLIPTLALAGYRPDPAAIRRALGLPARPAAGKEAAPHDRPAHPGPAAARPAGPQPR